MVRTLASRTLLLWITGVALLGLGGCGGSSGGGGSKQPVAQKVAVSGAVVDRLGQPVAGVTVTADESGASLARAAEVVPATARAARSAGGVLSRAAVANAARAALASATATTGSTNAIGTYLLENVEVPASGKIVLTFEKAGMATYQRVVEVASGVATVTSSAVMAAVDYTSPAQAANGAITVASGLTGGKLDLAIPAGALLDANGLAVTGNVVVEVTTADPTVARDRMLFPGDFLARDQGQADPITMLESVAFAEITVRAAGGTAEYTRLDPAKPATLRVKLPDSLATSGDYSATETAINRYGTPKNEVPWWSYNEDEGNWEREDADPATVGLQNAKIVDIGGALYAEAKVIHFTWWNADQPITTHAYIKVRVKDGAGNLLPNVEVFASGVTYNGDSAPKLTGSDGVATVTVKRSAAGSPERVKVAARYAGRVYEEREVVCPATDVAGGPVDVTVGFEGLVTGTVRRDDGTRVAGAWVYSNLGIAVQTVADGTYSVKLPLDEPISLYVQGANTAAGDEKFATFTLTEAQKTLSADFKFPPVGFVLARRYFEDGDVARAHAALNAMKTAGTLDANAKALFALTTVLMVAEDAKVAGEPFYALLEHLGLEMVGDTLDTYDFAELVPGAAGPDEVPSAKLKPALAELVAVANEARALAAGATGVDFNITVDQGTTIQVDDADVLALRSALSFSVGLLEFGRAYDASYQRHHGETGPEVSPLNLQDLVLAADASARLGAAKQAFKEAIDALKAAGDKMIAEVDDQGDDLLTLVGEEKALWNEFKLTLDGVRAALDGAISVRFVGGVVNSLQSVTEAGGSVVATYQGTYPVGFLRLNLAPLFAVATALDGAKVKAEFDAGLAEVTVVPAATEWDEAETYLWFSTPTSYLASLVMAVLPDALFAEELVPVKETRVLVPFRATANGAPLVAAGQPLDLDTASGVEKKSFPWTTTVGKPLAKATGAITIGGGSSDWGGIGGTALGGLRVAWASDASKVSLLVRWDGAAPRSLGLAFADERDPWSRQFSVHAFNLGGTPTAELVSEGGTTSVEMLTIGTGNGYLELSIPRASLTTKAGGKPLYLTGLWYDAATTFGGWDRQDVDTGLWGQEFWGYRMAY